MNISKLFWALNYLTFYLLWCLCVWGASQDQQAIPLIAVILYLIIHLAFVSRKPLRETLLIVVVTALGCLNESILAYFQIVLYRDAFFLGVAWWTICLYACFATTLWYSFSWLLRRPLLATFLGATAMPICYLGIAHARAISFPLGEVIAFAVVGLQYAILVPLLAHIGLMFQSVSMRKI